MMLKWEPPIVEMHFYIWLALDFEMVDVINLI